MIPEAICPGPQVAVGAIVVHEERILLVQRRNPPSALYWAIPGGRQRLGETMQAAAEREILDETGIIIRAAEPIYTTEYIERDAQGHLRFHYTIVDLAADYLDGIPKAADDALRADWVAWAELPGRNINRSSQIALRRLFPAQTAGRLQESI
jgi:ADP-ribose pyrophosphatase